MFERITGPGSAPEDGDRGGAMTDAPTDPVSRRDAERWLEVRLDDAPARLGELVRQLLERAEPEEAPENVAGWLAWAAYREFVDVDGGDRREDSALRLLAADAALTYAFEAAAEDGSDLAEMARSWGVGGRLGHELATRLEERERAAGEDAG